MILIEGKKFACDTCIKGHRSSACKHTDRPLFEIQKKGRPITQCSHCRELRKTKQVHVKCQCGEAKSGKEELQSATVKSLKKAPDAVYPAGVSATLQASIVLIPDPSSDSDQSGCSNPTDCSCKTGGQCHCAVPRKIKRTRQKDSTNVPISPSTLSPATDHPHPDPTREYRPVLPKPSHAHDGPVHVPSFTPSHGHVPRHHPHPDMLYSPYGRAYETAHSHDRSYDADLGPIDFAGTENTTEANDIIVSDPDGQPIPWNIFNTIGGPSQSLCCCGESCACPGCFEHRGSAVAVQALLEMSASSGCANPSACTSCVECSISPTELQNVDEWLRQLTTPPGGYEPLAYTAQQQMQIMTSNSLPQYGNPYISSDEWIQNQFNGASECCGGRCKCPPGLCACASDCGGCGQGRSCDDHKEEERAPLTLIMPGEGAPCCNGQMEGGSLMDTEGMLLILQPPITRSPSDASFESQESRASPMSIGEMWDGVQFAPNPSPVRLCCSKERTTLPTASLYASTDDTNIF